MTSSISTLGIVVDTSSVKKATLDLNTLKNTSSATEIETNKLTSSNQNLGTSFFKLSDSLSRAYSLFKAYLGLSLARQVASQADAWSLMESRLMLVAKSENDLVETRQRLIAINSSTRSDLQATAGLYTTLALSAQELNRSQEELYTITELVQKSVKISGTNSVTAAQGIRQFSQALASGTLRGDELNSILENMPRLASAIAAGMGTSIGSLRKLGEEGKLTASEIVNALLSQKDAIIGEFGKITPTIGDSLTAVSSSFLNFIGVADKASGASMVFRGVIDSVAKSIDFLTKNFDTVQKAALTFAIGSVPLLARGLVSFVSSINLAVTGLRALSIALIANPFTLVAVAIFSTIGLLYTFGESFRPIMGSMATLKDYTVAAFKIMGDSIASSFNFAKQAFLGVVNFFSNGFNSIGNVAGGFVNRMGEGFTELFSRLKKLAPEFINFFLNTVEASFKIMGMLIQGVYRVYVNIFNQITEYAVSFYKDLKSILSGDLDFSNLKESFNKGFTTGVLSEVELVTAKIQDIYSQDRLGKITNGIESIGEKWKKVAEDTRKARIAAEEVDTKALKTPALKTDGAIDRKTAMQQEFDAYKEIWKNAGSSFEKTFSSSLSNAFQRGKFDFVSMVNSIKQAWFDMVAQLIVRWAIFKAFAGTAMGSSLFGFPMAAAASPVMNAAGGVVDRATSFLDTSGRTQVMGEAGPEAILPLTRGSNGDLGVRMVGNTNNSQNAINIVNNVSVNITSDTEGSDKYGEQIAETINKALEAKMVEKFIDYNRPGGLATRFNKR